MDFCYYFFFIIIYSAKMFGLYDGQMAFYLFLAIGLAFYAMKMMSTEMTISEFIVAAALMIMGLMVYLASGEKGLLLCMAVVTGAKNIDHVKLFKLLAFVGGILFLLMTLLTSLGLIGDNHHITEKFGLGQLLRRDFGQPASNVTHTVYFVIVSLVIFLYGNGRHLIRLSLLLMIINAYLFTYTLSVTGGMSVTFLLILNYLAYKVGQVTNKIGVKVFFNVAYFLLMVFSILLPICVKGRTYDILNKLLNHRMEYGRYYLLNERLSFFGRRFSPVSNTNMYLDNSYLYLFLQLGIITFGVMILILFLTLNGIIRANDKASLIMFVAYSFIGLSDPFLFNTSFKNMTLVLVGKYLYDYLGRLSQGKKIIFLPMEAIMKKNVVKKNMERLIRFFDCIALAIRSLAEYIDKHINMVLTIFIVIPLIGMLCYRALPGLFDISLLAEGDRLIYQYELIVQNNHFINLSLCILRTGILDGVILSIIVVIGRYMYDRCCRQNSKE